MKRDIIIQAIFFYFAATLIFWVLRFGLGADCVHRYMDYIFPLTKLHCEVK